MRGWRVLAWSAALLTGVLGAPAPLVSDEIGSADAPWFNMTGCHHPSKTIAQSHGVHDPEHAGMTLCQLTVTICGDLVVERHQSINPDTERCPASLKFTTYPSRPVCCERWQSGKARDSPCNGTVDADCDGISNKEDDQPLTPNAGAGGGVGKGGGNASAPTSPRGPSSSGGRARIGSQTTGAGAGR